MKNFFNTHKLFFYFLCLITIIIIIALTINWSKVSFNNKPKGDRKLTDKQWIEDINFLTDTLSKNRPTENDKINQEDFNKSIKKLIKDIPKLSDSDINLRLVQIMASLGNGHDSIQFKGYGNYYPLMFQWFGNDYRVIATTKDYEKILGAKLICINDVPVNKVMNKINTLIANETDQWVKYNEVSFLDQPEILKYLKITDSDIPEWKFENENNEIVKINIIPKGQQELNQSTLLNCAKTSKLFENMDAKKSFTGYWYKYMPEDKIMYFQYNTCVDRDMAKALGISNYNEYPVFGEFSDSLIKEINKNNIEKLVIDLRHNSGGNSSLIGPFIIGIRDMEKINKRGKIFIIIGPRTFSSATINALDFKNETQAIIAGEPSGGSVKDSGEVKSAQLPNSKITFSYSTKLFNLSDKYKDSIIPDMPVTQSFIDYKNGIDDVYETIKNYKE